MGLLLHGGSEARSEQPNILIVYADDLGWKDPAFMGSDFYETPHLDRLAKEGIVFSDAYSCAANCAPARACLLSGQYSPRHEIYNVGTRPRGKAEHRRLEHIEGTKNLRQDIVTWAEALQQAGYRTGMFGKWHLGPSPKEQGFDVAVEHNKLPGFKAHVGPNGECLADVLTDKAIEFIKESGKQPWCVYLAHYAVHVPLQPKKEHLPKYREKKPGKLHDHVVMATMVQSIDDGVGRLLETLDELGERDNTVVIFFSDNGGYGPATDMDPLWGYKGTYYEGGIRVPLVVNGPIVAEPGRTCAEPVIGVDLYPTLLDLAGATAPDQPLDGKSLVPLLKDGKASLGARPLFWHFPAYLESYSIYDEQRDPLFRSRPCSVVRMGDYKLHEYFEDGGLELYNLRDDIRERNDLASAMPEKVREMHEALKSWRKELRAAVPNASNPEFDPEAEARAIKKSERKQDAKTS
ncbi:Arylsulfatase [Planctomycetes bacterium Pan216]|uniref:Arylsulfatase n=1 Tax=Kolteria novifilia TaxID=2527975 RepID=A0A518B0V7_9BACT|nr:Arylsulfatase [Planctomycetes bacterium Pan216]